MYVYIKSRISRSTSLSPIHSHTFQRKYTRVNGVMYTITNTNNNIYIVTTHIINSVQYTRFAALSLSLLAQ